MPEYLAPGVFVEEVSFRQKSIEGVSTSTTGFVGPCRFGPIFDEPSLLTSFADFERIYGGLDRLVFHGQEATDNYLAQAVRAYFAEGGRRLYVGRVFNPLSGPYPPTTDQPAQLISGLWSDGHACWESAASPPGEFTLRARYPGAAGNFTVTFLFKRGQNVLDTTEANNPQLRGVSNRAVVWAQTTAEETASPPGPGQLYWIERYFDETSRRNTYRLRQNNPEDADGAVQLDQVAAVRSVTVTVTVSTPGKFSDDLVWEDLTFHPDHPNALSVIFAENPAKRSTALYVPLIFTSPLGNGSAIAEALTSQSNIIDGTSVFDSLGSTSDADRTFRVQLTGGNDGEQPEPTDYEGVESNGLKSGLLAFEDLEEISIVAAPGSSFDYTPLGDNNANAVWRQLIAHCERMRYRVAILDSTNGQTIGVIRTLRGTIDTTRAALYYPWIRISDPITEAEIFNPPSGHLAGIYARNDIDRGVHKSPANEVIRLALGYEFLLNKAQQEVLNPEGINCLRFFEGRGYRVWGARTTSSDPEWKYLNVRRYFAFLERSIEKGTQWVVFENNGDVLWANVRSTIEDFLFNEWKENHLLGTKPEQAYFVRCDRTTMTQNDIDNGRLICLIGVAPLRPAEFVIFRIGQKTADSTA